MGERNEIYDDDDDDDDDDDEIMVMIEVIMEMNHISYSYRNYSSRNPGEEGSNGEASLKSRSLLHGC